MRCAQSAATNGRVVHTVAELQMALADKARGQNIARLRKRKRFTQQALAEKLKIGYRTVQGWEAGTMPEWPNLEALAEVLGVRPEDIIGDEDVRDASTTFRDQLDRIEANQQEILERLDLVLVTLLAPDGDSRAAFERELEAAAVAASRRRQQQAPGSAAA